jgi:O-acetylhomoserine (thiol)-lyase
MKGFSTKAIHGKALRKDPHGSLRFPLYDAVAFEHESARDIQLAFEGRKPAHTYSRITNPSIEDFEQRIKLISDGLSVVAVSSGMAAISNLILAVAESGSNIVTTKFLFGNTYSLFEKTLKPWGLNVRYINIPGSGFKTKKLIMSNSYQ